MAENKQEKKTIQVGDQKYLVDDILGLSAAQLNNYFNFARDKGGYDDEGIASLRNYINKRLDNIKAGQGFNADGSFDGDVVENVTMKVKKPGGFGKKEITQGNRDWANNYFYHLVKNLKPYQETEDKPSSPTWDISKHGLNAYLTGQGLDAKYIFENYDLKDTNNPDAARSFKQRRELLKQHLGGYRDWLKSKGFDFTKNDNEWDDNYLTDFESFVNNFDTLDNNALTTALRKYGAGNYTTAFTSDKWDLTKTNADLEAEADAKAKEAEAKKKAEYMKSAQDTFLNAYTPEQGFYLENTLDLKSRKWDEGVTPTFMAYYSDLNEEERKKVGTYLGNDKNAWNKAYQTLMNTLKTGTVYDDANKGVLMQRMFEDQPNGFTDVGNGLYLVNDSVNETGQAYVYDPQSHYMKRVHLSDYANQNEHIKKHYEKLLYNHISKNHGVDYNTRNYIQFQQGGSFKFQENGFTKSYPTLLKILNSSEVEPLIDFVNYADLLPEVQRTFKPIFDRLETYYSKNGVESFNDLSTIHKRNLLDGVHSFITNNVQAGLKKINQDNVDYLNNLLTQIPDNELGIVLEQDLTPNTTKDAYNLWKNRPSAVKLGDLRKAVDVFKTSHGLDDSGLKLQSGGVMKAQLGSVFDQPSKSYDVDTAHKEQAAANGVDVKTQKARNQYINEDNKSLANPNAGLTTAQKARIGYAAADLTSAVAAFFPGAGTVVSAVSGLGSTFGNLYSDLTDDAVTAGQAWKNFGMNLGMDALGLIPGGGAASKMGKIVKSLKTVVPAVIALPGVVTMLSNSPEIAASWKKAFDGDPSEGGSKMDYQDYMNILQVLNVAAGVSNIATNTYKSAKRSTKQSNKLAVDVVEAGTTNRKALVLEGDDVAKFKEANAKGEAQKFVDELEGQGKYTINEITESNKGKFWGRDGNGKFEWFHQNPLGQSTTGKANTLELKWDNKKGILYAETGKWDADLRSNKGDLVDTSATHRYNSEISRIQGELDAVTGKMKESMSARAKRTKEIDKQLTPERTKLTELQARLRGVADPTTLQTNKASLESDITNLEQQIAGRQQMITQAEADLQKLLGKKRVSRKNRAAHQAAITSARGKVQGHKTTLQGLSDTKQRHLSDISTIESQLKDHAELPNVQNNINRLERIKAQLDRLNHTHAYDKLQSMVADLKANHSTIEGRTVNWDINEILQKAGIRSAFKEGGSINKNKINKFLKYAKG